VDARLDINTVAALGDAPEDGSVSGRHLLGDEAEPSRKIPSPRKCYTIADGATIALEMIGPRTVITLRQLSSLRAGPSGWTQNGHSLGSRLRMR
jgi:hypothetical protein